MEVYTYEESLHTKEIGGSGDDRIGDGTVVTKMGI